MTDSCILNLHPTALLNSFTSFQLFSGYLWIFYIQYHVICKQRWFYLLISTLDAFCSFPGLISLARTSTMTDILALTLTLEGKLSVFPTKYDMSVVGFSWTPY